MNLQLDFESLPEVVSTSILDGLDRDLERDMQGLGFMVETLDRARGAVALFDGASAQRERWRDEAHIRGGLAEFKSIDDSLVRDLRQAGDGRPAHKLRQSRNPLVHLMSLMRDVNIHASRSRTDTAETTVIPTFGEPRRHTYKVPLIINLSIQQLLSKREASRLYSEPDLRRVVKWFEDNQRKFGAPDLLARGVGCFCQELIELYAGETHAAAPTNATSA